MTVEQTVTRVYMNQRKGWDEAEQYSQSFLSNRTWGYLLQTLTLDTLKADLGITKYGHRVELMLCMHSLFPGMKTKDREEVTKLDNHLNESPMSFTMAEKYGSSMQSHKFPSSSESEDPDRVSPTHSNSAKFQNSDKQAKEVMKWAGRYSNMNMKFNFVMRYHKRPLETLPPEVLSFKVRGKCSRTGPSNPIFFKALGKVRIRSGKLGDTNSVSFLPKGSVVTFNRINGRSGMVVVHQQNGEHTKRGWVTLYTRDKLPLLEKFSPTIAPRVVNRSLALQRTSIVECTE